MHSLDTLFLDRDGVINVKLEARYVRNSNEFEFMQGALVAISKLSKLFKRILIVTNQQGIGKGIMTEDDLNLLHSFMTSEIGKLNGKIDKIYFCPHLDTENCNCRKPNPGMINQAIADFPDIDCQNSYLIGDSDSDIEAGNRMNLNTVKVDNEYTLAKWTAEIMSVIE
jgi:D-glycero-D-manno-heptose 1,7-bisphosphate phosphatase